MSTKHRFLAFARTRVRSTPSSNALSHRLAPRSIPVIQNVAGKQAYHTALTVQEHDIPDRSAVTPVEEAKNREIDARGNGKRRMALTSSLDDLADDEVIQVLEEALDITQHQSTATEANATTLPLSPPPSTPPISTASPRTAASFVTLILSLRSRPTYRHILSLIPPHTFRALLQYLLHQIGAIHLVHLLLGDILTRSFGRLEIVYEALEVCAGAVEGRYVGELVEMMDDSYFGGGERTLSTRTARKVLQLVSEKPGMVSEQRTIRLVEAFAGAIRESKTKTEDNQLLQRILLHVSLRRQRTAVHAIHRILLANNWIQDTPSLHKQQDPYAPRRYTSLGIVIALIRTANTSLQSLTALEYLLTAYTEPLVHPHSRLRRAFAEGQEETFRCTLAQRDPRTLEKMGEVLVLAVTRGVEVDPRIVQAFYKTCDEVRLVGVVRRVVRGLWEHGVDGKAGKTTTTSSDTTTPRPVPSWALPTGRVLAHLLEFMGRKETPWEGDDRRMLGWFLGMIEANPGVLGTETAGRCLAGICGLPGGAEMARRIYERLVEDEISQDHDTARQRMSVITEPRAMAQLVKAYTTHPLRDLAFAQSVIHRHIQHSPPLRDLSSADLARLSSAFFKIDQSDAGVRMLKYLDDRTTSTLLGATKQGLDEKAISVLQRALKTVPHVQGKTYLDLVELALTPREGEVIPGKRLLDNFWRKAEKAAGELDEVDRLAWRDRLEALRARWLERYEKRRNERAATST